MSRSLASGLCGFFTARVFGMLMTELIAVSRDGAVATVTLNRPEKLNALTKGMWRSLGEIIDVLSADDGLRCVIVRGAGEKAI